MGKIVKGLVSVVAIGVGTALSLVPGFQAVGFGILQAGLALGISTIKDVLVKGPKNSPENFDRLRASLNPRTPRKTVVGYTAMATDIRDEEFTEDQTYYHRFIVCASHKVNSVDEIWFDDKLAWSVTGGAQGEFAGYLDVDVRTEGNPANAINISPRMGNTRRYTGMAYVHLRYKLTGNSKKTESPFAQSITTRVTIRGGGAALYDPREDSNVEGGAGSHDPADQSTWIWDSDAARNPALQLLFFLLGYRITNPATGEKLLAVGKGIPADRIDLPSFAVAANICDELVAKVGGGTEPRYRSDGVWSEGDNPTTVMDMLKANMNADLDDVGGKLRITIFQNDLAMPVADFTDDDILDDFEWVQTPPLDKTFNVVAGVFTDPSDTSLYQQIDYPRQESPSPDGIDRIDTFDLPMVQSASQAQRLAGLRKARMEHGAGTFKANFKATGWRVQKNSVLRLTFRQTGFVQKLFRVADMEIRRDGVVPLTLREESPLNYANPALAQPVEPIATTPYDFRLNPIIQSLATAEQSLIATSSQSSLTVTATDTSLTISNHQRNYTDKTVAITGATINGLTANRMYHLFYDDGGRAGGAVTWQATTDFFEAQNDAGNPDRHYGGYIRTDTAGGGGTTGGGSVPPGSGGTNPYEQIE